MTTPSAPQDEWIERDVGDEVVVLDSRTQRTHLLDSAALPAWRSACVQDRRQFLSTAGRVGVVAVGVGTMTSIAVPALAVGTSLIATPLTYNAHNEFVTSAAGRPAVAQPQPATGSTGNFEYGYVSTTSYIPFSNLEKPSPRSTSVNDAGLRYGYAATLAAALPSNAVTGITDRVVAGSTNGTAQLLVADLIGTTLYCAFSVPQTVQTTGATYSGSSVTLLTTGTRRTPPTVSFLVQRAGSTAMSPYAEQQPITLPDSGGAVGFSGPTALGAGDKVFVVFKDVDPPHSVAFEFDVQLS